MELPVGPDEAITEMRASLGEDVRGCSMSAGRCMELFVKEDERHFWSPHLSVQLEERDGGSLLRGRYAPHPEVWTLFVFLYASFAFAGLVGLGWGYAQWILGRAPWGLLLVPAAGFAIAMLYVASRVGQRLGAHQMAALRGRLDTLLSGVHGGLPPTG